MPESPALPVVVLADASGAALTDGDGRSATFHAMWLRDACACPACRRATTGERLLDPTAIPPDITITSAEVGGDGAVVLAFSDGHATRLDIADVLGHRVEDDDRRARPAGSHHLWSPSSRPSTVDRSDLDRRADLQEWLDAIWDDGMAIVRGVEPSEQGLLGVAALIGHVLPSNYGSAWEIDATVDPQSAVDSELSLRVHTDLPYRDNPPGVQLMLAAIADVAGGDSTFVDGYAIAEQIRRREPEAWELLTTVRFSYAFVRPGTDLTGRAPLIGLRADGSYDRIRRAPDLVGVPIVEAGRTPDLYRALRLWSERVDDPANQRSLPLGPGHLVAFDNRRVLHGRTAFALGASGRRRLLGCYLDIDELVNRRAVLRGVL